MPQRPNVANLANATPEDLKWLADHYCKHGHRYLAHFNCFLKEHDIQERIGCLDIECGSLKANVDIMLSWAIKEVGGDTYYDAVTPEELAEGGYDRRIVETCVDTMHRFDRVVGHYSTYFDIPFIRTRALAHGLDFPKPGVIYHTDVWKMARKALCLSSNRQDTVAETIIGKNIKTRVDFRYWTAAKYGSPKERRKALKYIVEHNLLDVEQLEANYLKLREYVRETRTSI